MSFVHYRLVLKLLSPLHIGKRKYRNLMETREYVPGRTLWGALTARIVRDYFDGKPALYEKIGDFLNENFRFGYLWPSLDEENPYFPWEHEDFDYLFKSGYMGQPIDYTRGATEEGQLHEAEFISPKTRNSRQVYLIGDLWVSDKNGFIESKDPLKVKIEGETIAFKDVFDTLQLGGERNYGWGRVKCEDLKLHTGNALGGVRVKSINPDVILEFSKDSRITAHAFTTNSINGQVEPFTGFALRKSTLGEEKWQLLSPFICYIPGSRVLEKIKMKIGTFGILL